MSFAGELRAAAAKERAGVVRTAAVANALAAWLEQSAALLDAGSGHMEGLANVSGMGLETARAINAAPTAGTAGTVHALRFDSHSHPIVTCTAPAGAPCHLACPTCTGRCTCRKPPVDMGECNWSLWLNEDDLLACGTGEVPITITWDGDGYQWEPAGGPA